MFWWRWRRWQVAFRFGDRSHLTSHYIVAPWRCALTCISRVREVYSSWCTFASHNLRLHTFPRVEVWSKDSKSIVTRNKDKQIQDEDKDIMAKKIVVPHFLNCNQYNTTSKNQTRSIIVYYRDWWDFTRSLVLGLDPLCVAHLEVLLCLVKVLWLLLPTSYGLLSLTQGSLRLISSIKNVFLCMDKYR